jgi:transcriptional regulator GlxA family with amidase domain
MTGVLHAHHALHFALALQGAVRVRTAAADGWTSAAGVLTAADVPHAVDALGVEVMLVFLDPESEAGGCFAAALEGPVRLLSDEERDALVRDVVPRVILRSGAEAWVRTAAQVLRVQAPADRHPVHPRVRRVLTVLRAEGVSEITSLETLAALVGLSPGRLMHVFTESIGIPLRPYLAWLRVQRAATAIVNGHSMGDAAHGAGFADSAHMTRTFKRMLGVVPSLLRPMRCSPPLVTS